MIPIKAKTRKIAYMGMMLTIILVLTYIEHQMPPLPFVPPNVKLGLSNIVTMYCLFFIGKKEALLLSVIKSLFVLTTRGLIAGLMSLSGGLLSIVVLILLILIFKGISYLMMSIFGALAHNLGQIIVASLLISTNIVWLYLPILIVSAIVCGSITGILLKVVMPIFQNNIKF